jgi:hypothetical protein
MYPQPIAQPYHTKTQRPNPKDPQSPKRKQTQRPLLQKKSQQPTTLYTSHPPPLNPYKKKIKNPTQTQKKKNTRARQTNKQTNKSKNKNKKLQSLTPLIRIPHRRSTNRTIIGKNG